MAKDLPYFKFFCSEWSDGDITLEDYETQGFFINVCSYYWSNNCDIELVKVKKRFRNDALLDKLIETDIIKVKGSFVVINFLDLQLEEREKQSAVKSKGGKASAEAKRLLKIQQQFSKDSTESQHVLKSCSTESQVLREDKIREEKKINNIDVINWQKLISQFNQMMSKKTKTINETVKASFRARIKEGYTKEDIVLTLENICKDEFHINNGFLHVTLEYVSRQKTIDKYINFKAVKQPIKIQERL